MFDEALYRSALAIRRAGLDLTITFKEDLHPRGFGGRWVKKHTIDLPEMQHAVSPMRPSPPPEADYRGSHHAPGPENGAPMHALDSTNIYPPDIYTKPQFYVMPDAADEGMEKRSYEIAQGVRGQPDAMVPVYRAGPVGVLNTGDWVTPNEDYAKLHSRDATDPSKDMPVWSFLVPASQLWTQGDSLNEYGFSGETLTADPAPAPTLVPAAPGETPIPEGAIRIWHYTHLENAPAIKEQGLRRDLARGDDGSGQEQESKGVWASTKAPDDGALRQTAFIEGWVMPEELSHNAEHYWNQDPVEWAKGYHHVILTGDLPPEQIAAIHEPWQQTFRYLMENYPDGEADGEDGVLGVWPDDAEPGTNDYSMEITPAAIAYRKVLGLPPVLKHSG